MPRLPQNGKEDSADLGSVIDETKALLRQVTDSTEKQALPPGMSRQEGKKLKSSMKVQYIGNGKHPNLEDGKIYTIDEVFHITQGGTRVSEPTLAFLTYISLEDQSRYPPYHYYNSDAS